MDGRFATGVALVSTVLLLSPFVPSAIRAFASLLPPVEAEKPWSVACYTTQNITGFYNIWCASPGEGNQYRVTVSTGVSAYVNGIYLSNTSTDLVLDNTRPIRVSVVTPLGRSRDILVPSVYHYISVSYEGLGPQYQAPASLLGGADKGLVNGYLRAKMPSFIGIEDGRMVVLENAAPSIIEVEGRKSGSTSTVTISLLGSSVSYSVKIDELSFNVPDIKTPFYLRLMTSYEGGKIGVEAYTPLGVQLQETKKFDQYSWIYAETGGMFSIILDDERDGWFAAVVVPAPMVVATASIYLPSITFMPVEIAPMYLGAGPKVSSFGYYFTSENGCVLLVRAVCENGDPLPAGTEVRIGSEYLPQVEYDVWYRIYPAGTPPPSTVFVTFEIPGYINISQAVAVSTGGALGDLQVFTVDEKGNPVPALVEVRMNGALVGSQQSTGVATFRGLSAGKATVSGVSTGLLSPPPIEVDVAPNRMSTATLVFRRIYDPSIAGKVSVTNTGSYPLVVTVDGTETYTVAPGETAYLELPAGNHYVVYTGTEPLLYEPEMETFTLEQGEEKSLSLQVSPARDENWLREWMENISKGIGVGDLAVTVVDKASGTPIPGATVYLDVGLQQTTNNSGLCYFKGVPTGDRKVKACAQGYFPTTATAKVSEGAATSVQVFLRGFLYEAKPAPPTGRYLILGFLAILLPGVVMIWEYRRR